MSFHDNAQGNNTCRPDQNGLSSPGSSDALPATRRGWGLAIGFIVLVGFPGILLMLQGGFMLLQGVLFWIGRPDQSIWPMIAGVALMTVGSFMVLLGAQKWRRPLYCLVFLAIGLVFVGAFLAMYGPLGLGGKSPVLLALVLTVGTGIGVERMVTRHYRRKAAC